LSWALSHDKVRVSEDLVLQAVAQVVDKSLAVDGLSNESELERILLIKILLAITLCDQLMILDAG